MYEGENTTLPSVCQRLSHCMNYVAPWYKPLFIGMFLRLASSFLALQIWNRNMSTFDCVWSVLLSDSSFLCSAQIYFMRGRGGQLQKNQLSRVREMSSCKTLAYQITILLVQVKVQQNSDCCVWAREDRIFPSCGSEMKLAEARSG